MGGTSFNTKGSAGATTQTVWFGAIIDRLNMLMPYNFPTAWMTSTAPAHYGNLWGNFNSSFGATITAPDGTTANSQLIVEDNTTNIHFIQAGTSTGGGGPGSKSFFVNGIVRMAAFLKAGTRTRAGFKLRNDFGGPINTMTVVFDLAGGQVGVAAAVVGTDANGLMITEGTQIIPYPNGWYLCIQDTYCQYAGNQFLVAEIFLDAGSGTAALNNNYAGNGTSGAYVWRTNLMPAAAWGINTQTFLDDFNSISTIDVNNTKAAGFNWYVGRDFLNVSYTGSPPTQFPSGQISVSNSVLTLTGPDNASEIALSSVGQVNAAAGTFVGQGFGAGKPTLMELRANWDYFTNIPTLGQTLSWWGNGTEWVISQGKGYVAGTTIDHSREIDIMEASGTAANATNDTDSLSYTGVSGQLASSPYGGGIVAMGNGAGAWGFPAWFSTMTYQVGSSDIVMQGGLAYQSKNVASNINRQPPNATYWNPVTYPANLMQPAAVVDYTQFHLYSMLVIPFWGQPGISSQLSQQATFVSGVGHVSGSTPDTAVGIKMLFFDGAMVDFTNYWAPNLPSGTQSIGSYYFNSDNQNLNIYLTPGGTTGQKFNIDYFRVMQ